MSYLEYNVKSTPTGIAKVLYLNWGLTILLVSVAGVGFLQLYSVAGGSLSPWAEPQMKRFALGMAAMLFVAMVPIWFWRNVSAVAYVLSVLLLVAVDLFGVEGKGAQRWLVPLAIVLCAGAGFFLLRDTLSFDTLRAHRETLLVACLH